LSIEPHNIYCVHRVIYHRDKSKTGSGFVRTIIIHIRKSEFEIFKRIKKERKTRFLSYVDSLKEKKKKKKKKIAKDSAKQRIFTDANQA